VTETEYKFGSGVDLEQVFSPDRVKGGRKRQTESKGSVRGRGQCLITGGVVGLVQLVIYSVFCKAITAGMGVDAASPCGIRRPPLCGSWPMTLSGAWARQAAGKSCTRTGSSSTKAYSELRSATLNPDEHMNLSGQLEQDAHKH
jgi:hypothetical protein